MYKQLYKQLQAILMRTTQKYLFIVNSFCFSNIRFVKNYHPRMPRLLLEIFVNRQTVMFVEISTH